MIDRRGMRGMAGAKESSALKAGDRHGRWRGPYR